MHTQKASKTLGIQLFNRPIDGHSLPFISLITSLCPSRRNPPFIQQQTRQENYPTSHRTKKIRMMNNLNKNTLNKNIMRDTMTVKTREAQALPSPTLKNKLGAADKKQFREINHNLDFLDCFNNLNPLRNRKGLTTVKMFLILLNLLGGPPEK